MTRYLPIFPLGTVLMPTQLLPTAHLRAPLSRADAATDRSRGATGEFGVVLIERGREVGGGDQRVATGTVARLIEADRQSRRALAGLLAGTGRFRVVEWLADDPYPQAQVDELTEPVWDAARRRPC